MRQISPAGIDLIIKFEGYHTKLPDGSCKAYLDRLAKPHVWTIGSGLTKGVHEGMILTREEHDLRFRQELASHERAVNRLVKVPIAQPHFDALVSFAYNCGNYALKRSTLLRKLNAKDYDGAEAQFARWNKAGGKVWRGLVRRRKEEAAIFAMGTMALFDDDAEDDPIGWVADAETMPQKVEESGQVTRTQVAAGAVAAAAPAGAAAMEATPPGTWEPFTTLAASMGAFASSSWQTVLAIASVCGALWLIGSIQSYRLSR